MKVVALQSLVYKALLKRKETPRSHKETMGNIKQNRHCKESPRKCLTLAVFQFYLGVR